MKRIILAIVVICMSLQPLFAQKKGANDNYAYYKALELIEQQGYVGADAQKLLEENIVKNPGHILSYLPLIHAYRTEGKYKDALELVNMAMAFNHKNSEVSDARLLSCKASIFEDFGNINGSISLMEQAVKKGKKSKEEDLQEFQKDLAQMYYDAGRYNDSDKVYGELLKLNSESQLALVGMSRNSIARGEYADALKGLDFCEKMDPNYSEIYRFKVRAYYALGEYKKATDAMIKHFEMTEDEDYIYYDLFQKNKKYSIALLKEKIVTTADNVAWKIILAELYNQCDMYCEAILLYSDMIKEYGEEVFLLRNRAVCYSSLGLLDLALKDIDLALEKCEADKVARLYLIRSGVYADAGRYQEALKDVDKFVERYPTYVLGYYYRGHYQFLSGNYEKAVASFSDGIEIDETSSDNYLQRARAYINMNQRERALKDLENTLALEEEPNWNRCFALHYIGRNKEALECMKTLINENSYDSGNYYNLACLYSMMNLCDDAVSALTTALELGYKDFAHISRDTDLDNIRNRGDFKALIEKYSAQVASEVEKMFEVMSEADQVKANETTVPVHTEVQMKKQYGGTYEVPCMVNGLPLMMIFDTGAADVTISSVEASFMYKNGYLTDNDIKGSRNYVTADGGVHAGTVIILKEVKLGEAVLKNVQASVVNNQKAPLLLGQSVLERFGKITIDNVNLKITIEQ